VPFIYSHDDIDALFAACGTEFADEQGRRAGAHRHLSSRCPGLRIGEALNLCVDDIDQDNDVLMLRAAEPTSDSFQSIRRRRPLGQYIALPGC